MPDDYPNIFAQPDGVVPLTKWDRDRIAFERAEQAKRGAPQEAAPPAAIDVTGQQPAAATLQGTGNRPTPTMPERPSGYTPEQIEQNPWLQKPGGAKFGGQTHGGYKTPTRPPSFEGSPVILGDEVGPPLLNRPDHNPNYRPDPRTPDPAIDIVGGVTGGGVGRAAQNALNAPPEPFQHHPDDTHPASGGDGTGEFIAGDSDASFRPGPLPKKPVTPGGKGGGGGGGGAGGAARGRLPLGDQRRTEAYDPTLDRADPRNIGIIDDSGRTNPKLNEQAQKGAIDPTAPGVKTGEAAQKFTNQYTKALAGAATYMEDLFHQKQGDPNKAEGYHAMTLKATGAPDDKTVADVFKVVDPNNELSPKERMELATRAMHDWYSTHGDTKNADRVAAEMLQYGNKQAQAAGKQILEATKRGDQQGAAQALKAAYDWLPDGMTADVKGNSLVVADAKGQVVNTIPLDPKMMQNLGLGLATGTLFWDIVQQRAGKPGTFAPPTPQPSQAIATSPPVPGASPPVSGASPPAGAAPGATPAPQAAPARPAQAPPPPAPARAGAPVSPPSSSGGPPTSPPIPLPDPQIAGPQFNTPQITRPPQNNQSEAPAPAAPGPTNTSQAAPETTPTDQRTGEPVVQGDQPAIDTKVPPPLKGPVQPTTTKRPIVAGEDAPVETKKTGGTQPVGPIAKPPEPTSAPNLVWDKDDPDSVPKTKAGKPNIIRRSTYPMSDDVKVAQRELAAADAKKYERMTWLANKTKAGKGTTEYQRTLDAIRKDIEDQHKIAVDRNKDAIREWRTEARAHDAQERKDLTWTPLKGGERAEAIADVDTKLESYTKDNGKAFKLYGTNPLRLYNTKEKWGPIRDAVVEVKALNPRISTDKLTDHVLTMMSHINSDKAGQAETFNDHVGPKGSRFLVIGEDLARNPVVRLGTGNSAIELNIPRDTLNSIQKFKADSYKAQKEDLDKDRAGYEKRKGIKDKAVDLFDLKGKAPGLGKFVDKVYVGDKPRDEL